MKAGRVADDNDPAAAAGRPSSLPKVDDGALRQRCLPLPRHLLPTCGETAFAHPAELDLARILSFYRVRWVYEPTSFHLSVDADGRPREQMLPDFYLPDHDLYIELTTMRQRLVTRKNRKVRRLRLAYPSVRIKLLYRRDFHRLLASCPSPRRRSGPNRLGRIVITEEQLSARIKEIARHLAVDPPGQLLHSTVVTKERLHLGASPVLQPGGHATQSMCGPHLIGFGASAVAFLSALAGELTALGRPPVIDRLSLSRYRPRHGDRRVTIGRHPRLPVAGRDVVLVTAIVSTGLSLDYVIRWLLRRGARTVRVVALLDRAEARLLDVPLEIAGFQAPNELLVGFGLALRREYRHLPYIALLARDPLAEER